MPALKRRTCAVREENSLCRKEMSMLALDDVQPLRDQYG